MDAEPETTTPEPTKPEPTPVSPTVLVALGIVLLIAGAVLTYLGTTDVRRAMQLGGASTHIDAKVRDTRISGDRGDIDYDVLYRFKVDGDTYSYTDATGRKNLWATVSHGVWDDAKAAKVIDVVYDEDDPWVNRPASSDKASLLDPAAGLLLGIGLLVWGVMTLVKARGRREAIGLP